MRGYSVVCLSRPKNRINIGAALRAAYCFDASGVVLHKARPQKLKNIPTDTFKAIRRIPVQRTSDDAHLNGMFLGCQRVGIEIVDGASSLVEFKHPARAMYLFGPEDGSLTPDELATCQHVIQIPTRRCMNLAATVNIVLYDRLAKGVR